MSDDADRAEDLIEARNKRALDAHAAKRRLRAQCPGRRYCRACDALIPKARRRALPTADLCIECQTDAERWRIDR